jgi:hypothetical protein
MTIQGFLALAVVLLLAGVPCSTGPRSGIDGESVIGPTRPVQRIDQAPDRAPYPTTLLILSSDRRPVARVTTGPDGRFEIDLPPGEYWVTSPGPPGRSRPQGSEEHVQVPEGKRAFVTIRFDSGMR